MSIYHLPVATVALAIVIVVVVRTDQLDSESTTSSSCDEFVVRSVTKQCRDPGRIKDLKDFRKFYGNLAHLTNECLRLKSPTKEPGRSSLLAEEECKRNGLFFYQVRQLGQLIERWQAPNELICTIEYTVKIYKLHKQLESFQNEFLARHLRLLANSVAWKCRATVAKRLRNIQGRASDSQRWINLIIGLVNLGSGEKLVSLLKPFERIELFVPTLERELPEISYSIGRDGFDLKSVNSMRLSFDSARMACKTLKPYHVNVLGSLGLLASLGYASPPAARLEQLNPRMKISESRHEQELESRWLLSALLCQSLRSVLKMHVSTKEGKFLSRFKVMPTQEADVTLDDERDKINFKLPETIDNKTDTQNSNSSRLTEFLSEYKFSSKTIDNASRHKLQLMTGPSYKLSRAIATYLDLSQKASRLEAVEEVIGVKLEFEELAAGDELEVE